MRETFTVVDVDGDREVHETIKGLRIYPNIAIVDLSTYSTCPQEGFSVLHIPSGTHMSNAIRSSEGAMAYLQELLKIVHGLETLSTEELRKTPVATLHLIGKLQKRFIDEDLYFPAANQTVLRGEDVN